MFQKASHVFFVVNFFCRKFIVNISAEDEDFLDTVRNEVREEGATMQTDAHGLNESKNENKKNLDKSMKKEAFEVPEFLYKFSSTFFKKASSKDKKIFKIFGKINKEKAKIRTERLERRVTVSAARRPEKDVDPELGNYNQENVLNKSFKKSNTKKSNLKLKLENIEKIQKIKNGKKLHLR